MKCSRFDCGIQCAPYPLRDGLLSCFCRRCNCPEFVRRNPNTQIPGFGIALWQFWTSPFLSFLGSGHVPLAPTIAAFTAVRGETTGGIWRTVTYRLRLAGSSVSCDLLICAEHVCHSQPSMTLLYPTNLIIVNNLMGYNFINGKENEAHTVKDTSKGAQAHDTTEKLRRNRWRWFIDYVKGKLEQQRADKDKETPADRAARRTANATYVIALFTIVLAVSTIGTLIEIHRGSADTHDLAVAAGKQADASKAVADLTAKQFTASQRLVYSQRALISVAPYSVDHPLSFPVPPAAPQQMTFALSLALTNNGSFMATDVHLRYEIYFSTWGKQIFTEPQQRQARLCDKPFAAPMLLSGPPPSINILAEQTNVRQWINGGFGIPDSGIIPWPPDAPKEKVIIPFIVGCVDYHSGAMPEPHQTGFIFQVRGSKDGMKLIRYGKNVSQDRVFVYPYGFSQGKSY